MTTENEMIETPTNDTADALTGETATPKDAVAELQRQLEALQADRAGMYAKLEKIAANNERMKALNATPIVAQQAAPITVDAFERRKAQTLDGVEADALAEQAEISEQLKALYASSSKVKAEQGEVEAALHAAEDRMRVLSAPTRSAYISARAELAGRALMGEQVDLSAVPATDATANMTVSDVQGGVLALKKRRDGLASEFNLIRSDYRALAMKYIRADGVVHACRFIKAKKQLADAAAGVMAAQEKTMSFFNSGNVLRCGVDFLPLHFEGDFNIPAFMGMGSLPEVKGFDMSRINCESLRTSGKVLAAVTALEANMNGSAA